MWAENASFSVLQLDFPLSVYPASRKEYFKREDTFPNAPVKYFVSAVLMTEPRASYVPNENSAIQLG